MGRRWRMESGRSVAIVLLVLGGAACSSGPPVLSKEFQSRAVSVCEEALAQKKAQGPFPFPDFNPTKPDLSKLPAIATSEAKTSRSSRRGWARCRRSESHPPGRRHGPTS